MYTLFFLNQDLTNGNKIRLAEFFEKEEAETMLTQAKYVFPDINISLGEEEVEEFGYRGFAMTALAIGGFLMKYGGKQWNNVAIILVFMGTCGCFLLPMRFPKTVDDVHNLPVVSE